MVAGQAVSEMDDQGRAAVRRGVVGLVFQQFNLIPSLDVAANLSFHARLAERSDPAREAELADRLGLLPSYAPVPRATVGWPAAARRDRANLGN